LGRTVSGGALRRKTSAGFASGQGFFLGITPAAIGQDGEETGGAMPIKARAAADRQTDL